MQGILFLSLFFLVTVWAVLLAWNDCVHRRLPNYLTFPSWVVFPVMWYLFLGWPGVVSSLIGGAVGFTFLFVPFLLRGAGAGDVKMMAGAGFLGGWPGVLLVLVITSVSGFLLGAIMLLAGRVDGSRLRHLFRCCVDVKYDRREGRRQLPDGSSEKVRIPYGVAIALGAWGYMLYNLLVRVAHS